MRNRLLVRFARPHGGRGALSAAVVTGVLVLSGCGALGATVPPGPGAAGANPDGPVRVTSVTDGDTFDVAGGDTVRVIGLDTPETKAPGEPVGCFGPEASARAGDLLAGGTVRLTSDPSQGERGDYGRRLAHVWLPDGRLFAEVMIAEGYGTEYTYSGAYAHQDTLRAAEARARHTGAGLWTACGGP